MRKFNKDDILDMDFKAYLASSGDEDDDDEDDGDQEQDSADEEQQIRKYKVGCVVINRITNIVFEEGW